MTEIPVLAPPPSGVLSRPYVTPAMFRGFPTWLDVDNLIPGGAAKLEDDALADVLLAASDWAVGACEDMLLHGHWVQGEQLKVRASSGGKVAIRPRDIPLRAITSLQYGWDPSAMTSLGLPDPSMWIEDGRRVSFRPGGGAAFRGPMIQFGATPGAGQLTYVNWDYIPGFPFALLASPLASGAMSVVVDDPSSILPGDTLRIYDPGQSEAVTVAAGYVPVIPAVPPAQTTIPLAVAAAHSHVAGTGVTGFPRKALQAIIAYGIALLMREDVSAEEPASAFGPAARTTSGQRGGIGSGLVNDAYGWLAPYKPTMRP